MSIPQGWQPQWDENQARQLIKKFDGKSHLLSEEQQQELQHHAEAYGIPNFTGDFDILDAIGQAGAGFVEGFTTLSIADHPDNEYEQIFRNLGHLAGFAPGILSKPAAILGARGFAKAASQMKSLPMKGADIIQKYTKQAIRTTGKGFVGRSEAMQTAKNFLLGNRARHVIEGAFHLGTATAISSWQGGVDQMIAAGIGGAKFGAFFRTIGNLTPGTSTHEKVGKAIAGSLFQGLPSTARGATTPEQVYEYVMGAYFGGNEVSWTRARARKEMGEMQKEAQKDPEFAAETGMDPEMWKGFDKLPEEVKPILVEEATKAWADPEGGFDAVRKGFFQRKLIEELGLEDRLVEEELVEDGYIATGEYRDGETVYRRDVKKRFDRLVTSGGEEGAQTAFAEEANKVGIPTVHYTFGGHSKGIKATGYKRPLTIEDLEEADVHINEANQVIGKDPPKEPYVRNLDRRNWHQVKWADSVYIVGEFEPAKTRETADGKKYDIPEKTLIKNTKGEGLAAQLAINNKKPVYFFNQPDNTWYEWGGDKFRPIDAPPKPPKRFAGLGTKNLTSEGKQAIQTLFQSHWKPVESATERIEVDAKETDRIEKLRALDEELEQNQIKADELNDKLIFNQRTGEDTGEIEGELAKLSLESKDLSERYARITNVDLIKNAIPDVKDSQEVASSEVSEKADVDFEGPTKLEIGKRSLQFTKNHLSEVFSGATNVLDKQIIQDNLSQLIVNRLNTKDEGGNHLYLRPNSKENLSEKWANDVEFEIKERYGDKVPVDFKLTPEARSDMRKWMTRKNLGRLVVHLQSDGKTVNVMPNPANPVSRAGNRKHQEEPAKRIEESYIEAGGSDKEISTMTLDHVTIKDNGKNRDLTLSGYRTHLLRTNKYNQRKADYEYNEFIGNSIKKMAENDYYPLGGSSDKDRIVWVKHHPRALELFPKNIEIKDNILDIVKRNVSGFEKALDISRKEFEDKYNGKPMDFNKMVASNLFYDLQMNGMEIKAENAELILTHPGFIKNSTAFNKRQQIWMNNAWSGDIEFIKKQGVKLNEDNNYNYLLVRDLTKLAEDLDPTIVGRKNSELPENVDGAIIVSDKVLDAINADFGNPESGQNKSFIVSPNAEKGALLGKYMMHAAGPEMSRMMETEGIHMIMQESAVKQRGLRNYKKNKKGQWESDLGDYDVKGGKLTFTGELHKDLSPEHVKGNFGVYGNEHFVENQRIPKQLLQSLLTTNFNPTSKEVIGDMFDNIVRKRWDGDLVVTEKVDDYLKIIKEQAPSIGERAQFEEFLVNNIDKVGIKTLVRAMKNTDSPSLSEAIYNKILRLNKDDAMDKLIEGDISEEEYNDFSQQLSEFTSIADRVLKISHDWVREQRKDNIDVDMSSMYMHKFIRDFRVKAVQNFLINSAIKPKIDNSAVGFMRPYDKAMRENLDGVNDNLKLLETRDDIFFLDDAFKKVQVNVALHDKYSDIKGKKSLEYLWKIYNREDTSSENKQYLENVFEAATVRVPMDSMSGAQVLKFMGFTGRKGHGILMHGRAMRAEGGADLDGDKSFMFFGGEGGFKRSWKEAYRTNKEEFYHYKNKKNPKHIVEVEDYEKMSSSQKKLYELAVSDNKKAIMPGTNTKYRDILAEAPSEREKALLNSKAYQYSPVERIRISEAAVNGRNQLGPAVVNKQVMSAAFGAIMENGGQDAFYISNKKGTFKISIETKSEETDKKHQRNMGRAQIGLASDPLDELGLTGTQKWNKEMWDAHFKVNKVEKIKSGDKVEKELSKSEIKKVFRGDIIDSPSIRGGILGDLVKVNRAYWSRNYTEGRKFSMGEILDLGESIHNLPMNSVETSFLARTGKLIHPLDWSDSIFGKINKESVEGLYKDHLDIVNAYDWLKAFLSRPTFDVTLNANVHNVMSKKLWTVEGVRKTVNNLEEFFQAIKGTVVAGKVNDELGKYVELNKKGQVKSAGTHWHKVNRQNIIQELAKYGEDFIVNDITDLASISTISKIVDNLQKSGDSVFKDTNLTLKQAVRRIHEEVDDLKIRSYLMAKDRNNIERYLEEAENVSEQDKKLIQGLHDTLYKATGQKREVQRIREVGDEPTAELDQGQIDKAIGIIKQDLTSGGIELFDQLMLGSLNRGRMRELNKLEKSLSKSAKKDPLTVDLLKGLRYQASKTRISRLGFNSNAISDNAIKKHLGAFMSNFKQREQKLSEAESNGVIDFVDKYKARIEDDGLDPALTESLMPSGYGGIKKGKLSKQNKALVAEIADLMSDMSNAQKQQLPYLTRGILGKDFNAMNRQDFVVFRNWLQDMKSGNFIQRMFHGKGPVKLNKRHWMLFPKAVNRELMRDDIVMMRQKGYFTDRYGVKQEGLITRPTHYIDIVQNFLGSMNSAAVNVSDKYIKQFNDAMLFHSGLEDSQKLWEIAVRKRETHFAEIDRIKQADRNSEVKERAKIELFARYNDVKREHNWDVLKEKKYTVTVKGERVEMTGDKIVNRINEELTGLFTEMYEFIEGKEGALDAYTWQSPKAGVKYDYKKFIKHLQQHISGRTPKGWIKEGITDVPSHFGVDGLRRIARAMHIDMLPQTGEYKEVRNQLINEPVIRTGHIGTRNRKNRQLESTGYFPHMFFDKATSKKVMEETLKKIMDLPEAEMDKEQKMAEVKKIYYKNKSLGGEMRFEELEDWTLIENVLQDIAEGKKVSGQKIRDFNPNERAGSMKARDVHMAGWSVDPVVIESYIRSLSNTYHRQLSQMFGKEMTNKMYKQMLPKWGKTQSKAWQNFMQLYVQDAIGNPSIVPDKMIADPTMRLKGTPYAWFADNRVRDRINKFGKVLGFGNKDLPAELRGIDTETLRAWSNLEAQYQMASLLAHPKSSLANIFGGTAHTIMSTGPGYFAKAKNYNYLSKINSNWTNKQAINDFVTSQGVLPEFLVYEMGLQKAFQNTKGKKFLEEISSKLARDPNMSEQTFTDIARNYGLWEKATNFAAKFMTIPERALRRDAFMAHYIQAFEKYGSAIKQFDHPYLIEIAKKGVKATQFLYNAPYRPAFARTALGKTMTRFQLWAWNSVRFRNDVHRQAKIYGFKPGTEEWSRFERTMQTDLFTFALANIFAYSMFESNLPQPWGWAQDWSDWIFGDEGERDKAFYGAYPKAVAPLQMVTPPALRMGGPVFNAILSDDWSRVSQYHIYAMFPFGRMARDVLPFAPGNLIENPMRLPEKIAGLPVMQLQRNITAWKDKEDAEGNIVPGKKIKKLYPGMG